MSDVTYNGWTNYETWNLALWIDNEQASHNWRCRMVQEAWDDVDETDAALDRRAVAVRVVAERLAAYVEENKPKIPPSFYADVLDGAIQEVNWREIALNWLEDVE